jgi:phage-related protein
VYRTVKGDEPMRRFMESLGDRNRVDAAMLIKLVEERGNLLREPHSKQIEPGLMELRRYQVRIFYVFRPGRRVVLIHGMVKKQDRIPPHMLATVRAMVKDLEAQEAQQEKRRGPS